MTSAADPPHCALGGELSGGTGASPEAVRRVGGGAGRAMRPMRDTPVARVR